ncbi:hypothetical protein KRMM14A1259_67080 [Krasilnikovia sp. MM14-A1259]
MPPLLVLHLLGPDAAAYVNVPWPIVVSTQMLLWNIGTGLQPPVAVLESPLLDAGELPRRPREVTDPPEHVGPAGFRLSRLGGRARPACSAAPSG